MEILLKNAQVFRGQPTSKREKADLLIKKGKITDIIPTSSEENISGVPFHEEDLESKETAQRNLSKQDTQIRSDREIIDLSGCLIVPGFVDMHTHLREPGFEAKETIATGTKSAARGGFTSIACMPNTEPSIDNSGTIEFIYQKAREQGYVNTYPIAAITKGRAGSEITEMDELASAGALGFSDDGDPVMNAGVMRTALEYSKMLDCPIISHCEDANLSTEGEMNEGYLASILGLRGIPAASESVMAAREILLARLTGVPVHIAHVSCADTVHIIRQAKKNGISVTAEATPHHLILTEEAVKEYDTNAKVNPPLRTEFDRKELIKGIEDGTIDCIASDHAPHTADEKMVEFTNAPFGISGLETAFAIAKKALVDGGVLTLEELINKMSREPANILNIPGGKIETGLTADVTVIDINENWTVDASKFASLGKNSPFDGWALTGKIKSTMVKGEFVYKELEASNIME